MDQYGRVVYSPPPDVEEDVTKSYEQMLALAKKRGLPVVHKNRPDLVVSFSSADCLKVLPTKQS